ncbi:GNAT family N-acetyltransferase [Lacihabitans soyangensis]|uniref:GNAT family N-acetyltransferase n=1 Tax=Lacihabitans soyangensis TaxID=869394 RepID=A0AAE3H5T9_9BACT|nr:GNAT family N-acetyltransferase [Lacihabitans soyangensis]MCP9765739.1 GNAT family N-acetyltransferase [Lacihabitans soyangensis]
MLKFERALTDESLNQILDLQKRNLKKYLSETEKESQGFVTAEHTFEQLKKINLSEPCVVITDNNIVVAYAIAMVESAAQDMPVFNELFSTVASLTYKNRPMTGYNYIFVGQLCIDKNYRGQGLVEKLYAFYKEELKSKYDFAVTDISEHNPRSLKAHQKSGFEVIHTFYDSFTESNWNIVMMDFQD